MEKSVMFVDADGNLRRPCGFSSGLFVFGHDKCGWLVCTTFEFKMWRSQ